MNNQRILLIIICLILCLHIKAEHETYSTVKVRGEYSIVLSSSSLSGQRCAELAREDAKRKALEMVCGTRISIWDQVDVSRTGETYNSQSLFQVDGEVANFDVINEGYEQSDIRSVETIFYCEAKVKVKKGVQPDPDFTAHVNGIKSLYAEGDVLSFNVTPYQNCYLKIFIYIDEKVGYRLYPNQAEPPFLLNGNTEYHFPMSKDIDYEITKETDTTIEHNKCVFIFTKKERPFYHEIFSRQEIENWIAKIPNNEKFLYFTSFDIRTK